MDTWMKYVLAATLPLFLFMVLNDTAGGIYKSDSDALSYVIVEPED